MKKLISILLAAVMILTTATSFGFCSYAEEVKACIEISSSITNAPDDARIAYDIIINDAPYSGEVVVDDDILEIEGGRLSVEASKKAKIYVAPGSEYKITRNEYSQEGYDPVEAETLEGVAYGYDYYVAINNESYPITHDEYMEKTNNEEAFRFNYYENAAGEQFEEDDPAIGAADLFKEGVSESYAQGVGYKLDDIKEYPASIGITARLVERPPATSFGKTSYYYSGMVTITIGDVVKSDDFTTIPSYEIETAKSSVSTIILTKTRTLSALAVNDILGDNSERGVYFSESINDTVAGITEIPESTEEVTLIDEKITAYEFVPYTLTCYEYLKQVSRFPEEVTFYGAVDIPHVHEYSEIVFAPTCNSKGYTLHTCSCGDEYIDNETEQLTHSYTTETVVTRATTKKTGEIEKACENCGDKIKEKVAMVKGVTLSTSAYTYDAKAKKPTVTVKDVEGKKLVANVDYTVSYPTGRKNVGKYTVKITLIGKYSGSLKADFIINPKGTTISGLTAKSKGFVVKWKKQATQTTGYQVQYSTSSKFSSAKTVTVLKNSTVSSTVKNLGGNKKYYVRIRTFKTVSGVRYYSSWSGVKSIKTKK